MDLEQINRERRRRGKRELTRQEAERATASRPPGDDMDMFLLTYSTAYIDDDSRTETHHSVPDTGGVSYDTGGSSSSSSDTGGSDTGGGGGVDP